MTTLTFSNRNLAGEYKATELDTVKEQSNRLTSICGKFYTVITNDNKMLEFVGKRDFDKWANHNTFVTDF